MLGKLVIKNIWYALNPMGNDPETEVYVNVTKQYNSTARNDIAFITNMITLDYSKTIKDKIINAG